MEGLHLETFRLEVDLSTSSTVGTNLATSHLARLQDDLSRRDLRQHRGRPEREETLQSELPQSHVKSSRN